MQIKLTTLDATISIDMNEPLNQLTLEELLAYIDQCIRGLGYCPKGYLEYNEDGLDEIPKDY